MRPFVQWEQKAREGYLAGYRAGHLDAFMGAEPSEVARYAVLAGYAMGYRDGYAGMPSQIERGEA